MGRPPPQHPYGCSSEHPNEVLAQAAKELQDRRRRARRLNVELTGIDYIAPAEAR
ncbi:hypothetical protein GT030_30975 [Streptomyces sp. SID1328]|uniref:hypothetical protein n=1 Tax=Streptomyces sp. SID1328 TaxID=2690250 RepID=UPI00136E94D8|nr:hypothetical protein [Streptomyces sp. SID1328]MYV43158.1 hypothetical protein [Streptomyces sp. SID1328]